MAAWDELMDFSNPEIAWNSIDGGKSTFFTGQQQDNAGPDDHEGIAICPSLDDYHVQTTHLANILDVQMGPVQKKTLLTIDDSQELLTCVPEMVFGKGPALSDPFDYGEYEDTMSEMKSMLRLESSEPQGHIGLHNLRFMPTDQQLREFPFVIGCTQTAMDPLFPSQSHTQHGLVLGCTMLHDPHVWLAGKAEPCITYETCHSGTVMYKPFIIPRLTSPVLATAWMPNTANLTAAAGCSTFLYQWKYESEGECILLASDIDRPAHTAIIQSADINNQSMLATGDKGGRLLVTDPTALLQPISDPLRRWSCETEPIVAASWHPTDTIILLVAEQGTVRLLDPRTARFSVLSANASSLRKDGYLQINTCCGTFTSLSDYNAAVGFSDGYVSLVDFRMSQETVPQPCLSKGSRIWMDKIVQDCRSMSVDWSTQTMAVAGEGGVSFRCLQSGAPNKATGMANNSGLAQRQPISVGSFVPGSHGQGYMLVDSEGHIFTLKNVA